MGTRNKLVLASLVSTMMVLACLIGLLPSQEVADIGASSSSGRVEMKDLIDTILGNKLTGEIVVKSPITGTRTFVVDTDNPYANIPVALEAGVTADEGDMITYVAHTNDAEALQEPGTWTGRVASTPVGDPFKTTINIGPLLTGATTTEATSLYLRALLNATQLLQTSSLAYEDISTNALRFQVSEQDLDSDNNGIVDNFTNIGPGQLWLSTNAAGTRLVAIQNLTESTKQLTNFQLEVGNTSITVPATDTLGNAGVQIGAGGDAFLMVQISDNPADLIDAFASGNPPTTAPAAIQGWADGIVADQPGALSTMSQYVDVSIIYEVGDLTTFAEVDDLGAFGLGADITFTGLELSNTLENPQIWSYPTFVTTLSGNLAYTNDTTAPEEWSQIDEAPMIDRAAGTVTALNVQTFSIFANLNTGLGLSAIDPNQVAEQTATDVTLTGITQHMAAVNVADAAADYRILIGTTEATFRDGGGDVAISAPSGGVNTIFASVPALDPGVYDVRFENRNNTLLFAELPQAFTVSEVFTLGVNFTDNTSAQNLSASVSPTSGNGLPADSYFAGDVATVTIDNFDAANQTAVWMVNNVEVSGGISQDVTINEDTVVDIVVTDTPDVFMLTVDLTDNTTAQNLAVNVNPVSGAGLADGEFFAGDMATVSLLNFDSSGQTVTWTVNGSPSSATDSLDVTMTEDITIAITAEDTTDPGSLPATVTAITPNSAPIFGSVVAQLTGTNLTETTTIMIGGTAVQGFRAAADNTTIDVIIPASSDTSDANGVTADVSVKNADTAETTLTDAFTYKRYYAAGGSVQTATTIAHTGATIDVALGDPNDRSGNLVIPALAVSPGNVNVIVRSAPAQTAKQNTETLGTDVLDTILAGAAGSTVGGTSNFAVFFYSDDVAKQNTPAVGAPTLVAASGALDITPGPNTSAMLLSQPVDGSGLTAGDVRAGLTYWSIASSFNFATDVQTTANDAEVAYQSTLAKGEVSPALDSTVADTTPITDVMLARLYSLNAFTMRSGAAMSADVRNAIIAANVGPFQGPVQGGTPLTITSPRGQLSWVDRIEFSTATGGKQIVATADVDDFTTAPGEDEFMLALETPAATTAGTTDVSIFLSSDPNNAAVVLPGFFQFTGDDPDNIPWLLLLGALVALLALFAGGDSGGGGGPCFIATAAYGTPMATEIDTLRTVRDEYLLTNSIGTAFVDTYYQVSPAIADVVAQSPALAALVRVLLVPVVFIGKVALMAPALSTFVAMSLGALYMLRRRGRIRA